MKWHALYQSLFINLDIQAFQNDALQAHNGYRRTHSAQPMSLDGNLNAQAQIYAQRLAENGFNQVKHDPNIARDVGENLYSQCGNEITGSDVAKNW